MTGCNWKRPNILLQGHPQGRAGESNSGVEQKWYLTVDKVVDHGVGSMDRRAGNHSDKYHCKKYDP